MTEKYCPTEMIVLAHREFLLAGGVWAEPIDVVALRGMEGETLL